MVILMAHGFLVQVYFCSRVPGLLDAVNRRATMTIDRRPRLTTPQWPNILIVPNIAAEQA
jgi:hypothetical protein